MMCIESQNFGDLILPLFVCLRCICVTVGSVDVFVVRKQVGDSVCLWISHTHTIDVDVVSKSC